MARIYVSSTFTDLEEYRKLVSDLLRKMRHEDVAMEYYVAEDRRPLDKCLNDVASCDLYIGIFAWRYGSIPPGKKKSITELEYRKASETGKHCLIFLLHEAALWPTKFVDTGKDGEKIKTFRKELAKKHQVSFFKSHQELMMDVAAAVHNWENEHGVIDQRIGIWRIQEAIKKHITDLKVFFYEWKSSLPSVPLTEELSFYENLPDFESLLKDIAINQIERNHLFEDVKTHLPKGYEVLLDDWRKFKQLLKDYFNEYDSIVARIKNENQEKRFSAQSIYTRAVNLVKKEKGRKEIWDYHTRQLSQNQYELNYGISYGSSILHKGFILIQKGTEEEIKKSEELHKIISDTFKSEYKAEFNKLMDKQIELDKQRISLFKVLENLDTYPDFPNTDRCNIIKAVINSY